MSVYFFYFFISFSFLVGWFLTDGLNIVAVGVTGRPHVVVIFEEAEVVVLGGVLRLLAAPDEVPDVKERVLPVPPALPAHVSGTGPPEGVHPVMLLPHLHLHHQELQHLRGIHRYQVGAPVLAEHVGVPVIHLGILEIQTSHLD